MYAEVSTMHMLSICAEWSKDEIARSLWSGEDKMSVYNWCRETRGRLPNLDKQTSGGGQIFKLVQARCPRPNSQLPARALTRRLEEILDSSKPAHATPFTRSDSSRSLSLSLTRCGTYRVVTLLYVPIYLSSIRSWTTRTLS